MFQFIPDDSIPTVITDEQLPVWFTAWLMAVRFFGGGGFVYPSDVWGFLGKDPEGAADLEWRWDDADRRPNVWRLHVQWTHRRHHIAQLFCDWMWVDTPLFFFQSDWPPSISVQLYSILFVFSDIADFPRGFYSMYNKMSHEFFFKYKWGLYLALFL